MLSMDNAVKKAHNFPGTVMTAQRIRSTNKYKSELLRAACFYNYVLIPHLESQISKARLSLGE